MQDHRKQRISLDDVQAMLCLLNDLHADALEGSDLKLRLIDGVLALVEAQDVTVSVATFSSRNPIAPDQVTVISAARPHAAAAAQSTTTSTSAANGPSNSSSTTRSRSRLAVVSGSDVAHACPCPWRDYRRKRPLRSNGSASSDGGRGRMAHHWCTTAPASMNGHGVSSNGAPASVDARRTAKRARAGHAVHSFLPLGDGRVVACLTIRRAPGQPRFTARERSIFCTLHTQVAWLYGADVMLASSKARALTPRERETLRYLLAGKSEKQIAQEMRISHNTIHTYVKTLHKHFRVSTRSELLARQSQLQVEVRA